MIEVGSVKGFTGTGYLIGVFEAEESLFSGAINFAADVLVVACFNDDVEMPSVEMIGGIGNLDEVAASGFPMPTDELDSGGGTTNSRDWAMPGGSAAPDAMLNENRRRRCRRDFITWQIRLAWKLADSGCRDAGEG